MRRWVVSLMTLGLLVPSAVALAHAALSSSSPADGAVVDVPVSEIVVSFTEAVTPVEPGFEVVTPSGDVVVPDVSTDDDVVYRLVLDAPLAGGDVEVRYQVTSVDAHVIAGSISFQVDAAAEITTTIADETSPTTVPQATSVVPSTTAAEDALVDPAPVSVTVDEEGSGGSGTLLLVALGAAAVIGVAVWFTARRRNT